MLTNGPLRTEALRCFGISQCSVLPIDTRRNFSPLSPRRSSPQGEAKLGARQARVTLATSLNELTGRHCLCEHLHPFSNTANAGDFPSHYGDATSRPMATAGQGYQGVSDESSHHKSSAIGNADPAIVWQRHRGPPGPARPGCGPRRRVASCRQCYSWFSVLGASRSSSPLHKKPAPWCRPAAFPFWALVSTRLRRWCCCVLQWDACQPMTRVWQLWKRQLANKIRPWIVTTSHTCGASRLCEMAKAYHIGRGCDDDGLDSPICRRCLAAPGHAPNSDSFVKSHADNPSTSNYLLAGAARHATTPTLHQPMRP